MAVFKRGNVWWYEFIFAERRIRESAKTSRKTIAANRNVTGGWNWRRRFPACR